MSSSPNCLQQTDEFINRQWRTVAFSRQKQRAWCGEISSHPHACHRVCTGLMFISHLPRRSLFHSNLCTHGTWSKEKSEWTVPTDAVGIFAQMCQLIIGLEAQFMVHSTIHSKKVARIRVNNMNFRPQRGKFTPYDTFSTLYSASLFIPLTI